MTVTTVRPTSTDRNSNVGTSGAASAFSVLDDSPLNDATQAQGTAHGGTLWLGIPSVTLAATERLRGARIEVRCSHDGVDVGHSEAVNVGFRDPTTNKLGPQFQAKTASVLIAGSFDQQVGGYNTSAPGGAAWSQAIIDRLQVVLFWLASVNGTGFLKISEVYVDYDVSTRPAVSGVTPSGYTTSTRPNIAWTTTAGAPQTAWQVKVFNSVTYGGSSFSADTSTADYDSGAQAGDAADHTLASDLVNGVTYKAYVRAAQDWSGPEGSTWYSDWAVSSAFTVSLTPPPTPVVAVTTQTGLPQYAAAIRVSCPINLLTYVQSTLEDGTTTGWAAVANTTISNSSSWSAHGTRSLQLSSTASGNMTAAISARPAVKPGVRLVATATGRSAASVRSVRIDIRWYDVAGALISTSTGTAANDATGADTPWYATGVAPATAYSADVLVNVLATGGAAEIHRFDKIGLLYYPTDPGTGTAGAALWTPGGYKASAAIVVQRSQRISPTIHRGPAYGWMHPQLYSAGALIHNTDGFTARQVNDSVVHLALDQAPPEQPTNVTAGMIAWVVRAAAVGVLDIGAADGTATDGMYPYLMPAVPGKAMTGSVWLWATASFSTRLGVIFTDSVNTQVGSTTWQAATLTTSPQKVSVSATPPAGAVYARLAVENTASATGVTVYLTQVRFTPSSAPTENWPGQVFAFAWEEVRNLSAAAIADGQSDVLVLDHEAPPGRPVTYRALLTASDASGNAVASIPSTPVHIYMDLPTRTLLKDPSQPENAMIVRRRLGTYTHDEDAQEFHPLERDADPVIVRDWAGGEDGVLQVQTAGELERYRLEQLAPAGTPLLVQWSTGGQTYIRVKGWDVDEQVPGRRSELARLTYRETARPLI